MGREGNNGAARMLQIRAAVLRKRGGPLRVETLEMEGPREDEVLVRVAASGICRTDIDLMDDWDGPPAVLGHEGAGVVERVGGGVRGVRRGDHVALSYQSCGRCRACRRGHPVDCERFWEANFGLSRLDGTSAYRPAEVRGHFFGQSSFAAYALATARNLVKVPRDIPLHLIAPLGCGIQTGAGTVMNSLGVSRGESVLVLGAGAVGMAAVMAARVVRASPIIGVDVNARRLGLALALGATHALRAGAGDLASRIAEIAGGGVDYALEITGDPAMRELAARALKPRGTVALIADPGGEGPLPGGRRARGVIQGDSVPQSFIPRLIALWRAGRFPFDRLIKTYGFKDINRAVRDVRRGGTIKAVLVMEEA
ncbi:MAG: NAD(P)-dependent alcohol dehydrogenase [Thermodesulfovibrionales bacterium]